MGRNLKIKRLIDPSLPTPTSLPGHTSSPLNTHFRGILRLWLFAQHEIPSAITADSLPRTQSYNEIEFKKIKNKVKILKTKKIKK